MEKNADYLSALEAAILIQHKCKSVYKGTALIHTHTHDQQTMWEGYVEIFQLVEHPEAICCYAWQHIDTAGHSKIFAVLGNSFINSARKAVESAIFIDAQPPAGVFLHDLKSIQKQLEECKKLLRNMGVKSENLSVAIEPTPEAREESERKRKAA